MGRSTRLTGSGSGGVGTQLLVVVTPKKNPVKHFIFLLHISKHFLHVVEWDRPEMCIEKIELRQEKISTRENFCASASREELGILTHFCPPFQHLLSERLTSLGIMGEPQVPPLNPSETIVL